MHPVWVITFVLVLSAISILGYVAWKLKCKRRNMEFVTILERRRLQSLLLIGMTLLLVTLIGVGTAMLG